MNDTFTVKAWWAWYSKQAGSLDEYDVLRCTGGARRRATFSDYITDASLGNPPSAAATRDRLPWVSVVGLSFTSFTDQQWTGVSVMEPSTLRDGANRDITPTRYVLLESAELVRRRAEYVTLWDAVASLRLPPEHDETIPLEVPAPADNGLLEGLETIADHVPGTTGDSDRRWAAAVHWAAAVAALLLQGGPVVITGGGSLGARARLAVFDAIVGFLPYGVRSGLAVGSCVDGGDEPHTHLAFGPAHTPSARCVELGTLPQVPAGAPEEYRRRLSRLIEGLGFDAVTAGLREFDASVAPADPGAVLGVLDRLDPFRAAVHAVEAGEQSVQLVTRGLNSLTDGEETDSEGFLRLVRCGIDYAVEPGGREVHDALSRHWVHEKTGPRVSALMAEALLNVVLSGVSAAADSTSCRARLDELWRLVELCRKEAEVLWLLPGSGEPADAQRLRYAADCLCLLGPGRAADGRADAVRVLRDTRRLTLEVLVRESADPVRLAGWLALLEPTAHEAPAWLRAWAVLPVGERREAALVEPRPTAEDALHVLTATVRSGRPDWTAEAVRWLWPQLCSVAAGRGESGPTGDDGATSRLSFRGRGGSRKPPVQTPARPGRPDARGTLRTLLATDTEVWQHCRARADVLSCLLGAPAAGPPWRESACHAYAQSLHGILRNEGLAPFLALLVRELATPVLGEPWGKEGESTVLTALLRVPDEAAAEKLRRRVDARNEAWRRRQAALETDRAVQARRLADQEAAHNAQLRAARQAQENQAVHRAALEQHTGTGAGSEAATGTGAGGAAAAPREGRGRPPVIGTGNRTGDAPHPLDVLAGAVQQLRSPRDIAVAWAPFTLDLGSGAGRRALELTGRWWERAPEKERDALFGHLERTLLTDHQCSVDLTADILHEIRSLIMAGHASGHSGGGWLAGPVFREAKRELRDRRHRVRELRRIRLMSIFNLAPRTPRKHKKWNRGSSDR
ncbi:hypothetical protein DIZ27_33675 [Streptomyces sp. NWU339]|uniref:hypothetical protein n=1 Tax=Streptomyces sp. NWU339 TaxID=2185284 RepID=UPI000D67D2FD|nr:hypothetical protein [Streptomyces sp. NWU339]PWI06443.1 hypothetical protein DIZ27_33675 [Streptomyces sp. NWU339]